MADRVPSVRVGLGLAGASISWIGSAITARELNAALAGTVVNWLFALSVNNNYRSRRVGNSAVAALPAGPIPGVTAEVLDETD